MIGYILLTLLRVLLYLLLGLLGLALLLLLVPAGVHAVWDGGVLTVEIEYGPLRRRIFPSTKAPVEEEKTADKQPEEDAKAKGDESSEKKKGLNTAQLLYSLEKLPPILGRALKRLGRGIRLDPLKVHILTAGPDPADTALLYGRLYAALSAAVPAAERLMRIRNQDVRLFVDFQEEQPDITADVGLYLRPLTAVGILLLAGGRLLGWYLGFRKLAQPQAPEDGGGKKEKKSDNISERQAA